MDRDALLTRARTRGVSPLVYWVVRAVLQPFFHVYFRLGRIGREHIPASGPVILAANHRSFFDPVVSWLLGALGAFPIDRGASDQEAMATARAILERGEVVLMFPEGTRVRPGSLGTARRGVGRIRPHRVRIRAGRALTFPRVPSPSASLAAAVTDRIWPCVELQWEWLGGLPRLRRAAVIGAGAWGTSLALALHRAGLEVDLGCRTGEQAAA